MAPLITKYYPVSYANAKDDILPHVEKMLTSGRGSATVDAKNNQLIVTDTLAQIKRIGDIIQRIDQVTAQVMIEARVIEVNSDFAKELGVDWTMSYSSEATSATGWTTSTDWAMNLPAHSSSSLGITFSRLSGVPFVLNARINALETNGQGRILSSPKILTLDNRKAKIKQGVQYPYLGTRIK